MDHSDIHIDVPAVNYKEMRAPSAPEGSTQIRERVMYARQIQLQRVGRAKPRLFCKSQMSSSQIRTPCELSPD